MAREKVDCSGCDNHIEIWGRSRKEVDRKANWLRGQNPLCSACRTKEYEKKAAECAVEAAENGWLELTGSEKQILFANKIRKEKMNLLDEKEHSFVIGSVKTMIKNAFSLETDEHVEYVKALIDKVIKGTWKPIEQRQAYLLKEGKHKGKIRFIRFDDFRLNANFKNIKGSSRYFGTDRIETYVVSPSNYAEILDFCDIHSFKLTQEAIKALDQAKAQFEKIPVVAIKKVEQEKIEEKQQEFVEITGIDESLADV